MYSFFILNINKLCHCSLLFWHSGVFCLVSLDSAIFFPYCAAFIEYPDKLKKIIKKSLSLRISMNWYEVIFSCVTHILFHMCFFFARTYTVYRKCSQYPFHCVIPNVSAHKQLRLDKQLNSWNRRQTFVLWNAIHWCMHVFQRWTKQSSRAFSVCTWRYWLKRCISYRMNCLKIFNSDFEQSQELISALHFYHLSSNKIEELRHLLLLCPL